MCENVFGRKVNYIRKQRKLTSEQLAEKCDVNSGHIRQIESGKRMPSYKLLVEICNNLQVSPEFLMEQDLKNMDMDDYQQEELREVVVELRKFTPGDLKVIKSMLKAYWHGKESAK